MIKHLLTKRLALCTQPYIGFKPDTVVIGQRLRIVTENKSEDFAFFWAQLAEGSGP